MDPQAVIHADANQQSPQDQVPQEVAEVSGSSTSGWESDSFEGEQASLDEQPELELEDSSDSEQPDSSQEADAANEREEVQEHQQVLRALHAHALSDQPANKVVLR